MPQFNIEKVKRDVAKAQEAEAAVRAQRQATRRRTKVGGRRREMELQAARNKIDNAMRPVRRHIAKLHWADLPRALERDLREVSAKLQAHRRSIKKMQRLDEDA